MEMSSLYLFISYQIGPMIFLPISSVRLWRTVDISLYASINLFVIETQRDQGWALLYLFHQQGTGSLTGSVQGALNFNAVEGAGMCFLQFWAELSWNHHQTRTETEGFKLEVNSCCVVAARIDHLGAFIRLLKIIFHLCMDHKKKWKNVTCKMVCYS